MSRRQQPNVNLSLLGSRNLRPPSLARKGWKHSMCGSSRLIFPELCKSQLPILISRRMWHFIPGSAVEDAASGFFTHALASGIESAPLFEEKSDVVFFTLTSDLPRPSRIHRPRARTAFSPHNYPVNAFKN